MKYTEKRTFCDLTVVHWAPQIHVEMIKMKWWRGDPCRIGDIPPWEFLTQHQHCLVSVVTAGKRYRERATATIIYLYPLFITD